MQAKPRFKTVERLHKQDQVEIKFDRMSVNVVSPAAGARRGDTRREHLATTRRRRKII
jgi:hypothetical protein